MALGHQTGVIEVSSNSWGPSDNGFTVAGVGAVLQRVLQQETTMVALGDDFVVLRGEVY